MPSGEELLSTSQGQSVNTRGAYIVPYVVSGRSPVRGAVVVVLKGPRLGAGISTYVQGVVARAVGQRLPHARRSVRTAACCHRACDRTSGAALPRAGLFVSRQITDVGRGPFHSKFKKTPRINRYFISRIEMDEFFSRQLLIIIPRQYQREFRNQGQYAAQPPGIQTIDAGGAAGGGLASLSVSQR